MQLQYIARTIVANWSNCSMHVVQAYA